jgi:hypothetical protein
LRGGRGERDSGELERFSWAKEQSKHVVKDRHIWIRTWIELVVVGTKK